MRFRAAHLILAAVALAPACSDYDPADEAAEERSAPALPLEGEAYGPCLADGTCDADLACVALDGASFCSPPCLDARQCRREADTDILPIGHEFACVAGYCDVMCKEAVPWCMDGQVCLSTAGGRDFCAWPTS